MSFFFFNDTATTEIYPLPLHDALPISLDPQHRNEGLTVRRRDGLVVAPQIGLELERDARQRRHAPTRDRSEEHTSELQSPCNHVCRLLLEKKKQYDFVALARRPHYCRD